MRRVPRVCSQPRDHCFIWRSHEEVRDVLGAGLLASTAHAAVEYVKVCSLYGAGFHYIPGTDTCLNTSTGDARVQTEGGTWRSLLPYPEGKWTTAPTLECGYGARYVNVGTFSSTDFTPNAWSRKQTQPVAVTMKAVNSSPR